MAKKARPEAEEAAAVPKPDFERALRVMNNDIRPAAEEGASIRGDLSAAWKVIEDDCHVNKKAAKDFFKLKGMSEELRDDYLRSFYGLMKEAGIGVSEDLVDKMGDGDSREMPVAKKAKAAPLPTMAVN